MFSSMGSHAQTVKVNNVMLLYAVANFLLNHPGLFWTFSIHKMCLKRMKHRI